MSGWFGWLAEGWIEGLS
jgi:hypothetical protein